MHLEEFIERLERGLDAEGFGYRLNHDCRRVEFAIDEDPSDTTFEATFEFIWNLNNDEFQKAVGLLFENALQRLAKKAAVLRGEATEVTRSIEEVAEDINRHLRVERHLDEKIRRKEEREDGKGNEEGQGRERNV